MIVIKYDSYWLYFFLRVRAQDLDAHG